MQLSDAYLKKREEWKEEGMRTGLQRTLRAMDLLKEGIGVEIIAQTTGFSIEEIEQISQRQNP